MIRPNIIQSHYGPASVLGVIAGVVLFLSLGKLVWEAPLPIAMHHYDQHVAGWAAMRLHSVVPELFPGTAGGYAAYLAKLPANVSAWKLTGRFDLLALISLLLAIGITLIVGKGRPDTRIIAGRKLYEGRAAHRELKKTAREECAASGDGIKLHPSFDWCISRDRETRHFFIIGSVGGGKTQIITPLALAAIERGDKCVIYDNKGDFTSQVNVPYVLLAPWDSRSLAWDIAKDCSNSQDARELAARLIAEGNDPMWHQAARQILTAIVIKLQTEKLKVWTWRDLHNLACSSQDDLLGIVKIYQPEARHLLEADGKTTQGILINFSASMSIVSDLASAWGEAPPEKRFAFSDWIHAKNPKRKVVILQGNGRYAELTRGYVQSVISLLAGRINSAEVGESKSRRLWMFLDEFPQLGKLDKFASILEVGRSKGVCVVLGAQDLAQIQELYGQCVGKTWGSLVGTQIVVRVNAGETAQWISKEIIGYATLEKTVMHEGKQQPVQTQQQLVMEASDISDYLGTDKAGVRAVIVGMHDANILTWPYTNVTKIREATVPAAWLSQASTLHSRTVSKKENVVKLQKPDTPRKPRLQLRQPTPAEMREMADTGSDIVKAGESLDDMEKEYRAGGEQ